VAIKGTVRIHLLAKSCKKLRLLLLTLLLLRQLFRAATLQSDCPAGQDHVFQVVGQRSPVPFCYRLWLEAKAAATAYKKQQQEEARVARQRAAEERRQAKKVQAKALATERALKKQQREAATAQKSHDTLKKRKRKASHSAAKNPTKRHRVVAA
jgi:hypothetical protein